MGTAIFTLLRSLPIEGIVDATLDMNHAFLPLLSALVLWLGTFLCPTSTNLCVTAFAGSRWTRVSSTTPSSSVAGRTHSAAPCARRAAGHAGRPARCSQARRAAVDAEQLNVLIEQFGAHDDQLDAGPMHVLPEQLEALCRGPGGYASQARSTNTIESSIHSNSPTLSVSHDGFTHQITGCHPIALARFWTHELLL